MIDQSTRIEGSTQAIGTYTKCKGWNMHRGRIIVNDHWSDLYHFITFRQ